MATLSGRVSSKLLARPAGSGDSEGTACRDCVACCSASRDAFRENLADAFLNIVALSSNGGRGGTTEREEGSEGTGGGASAFRAEAFVDEVLRRNEKLLLRDLDVGP